MIRVALIPLLGLALALGLAEGMHAQPAPLNPDRVTFFTEPNYKGEALTIEAGASVEDLERLQRPSGRPWLFAISSVRLEGAAKATIFSAPRYGGESLEIARDIPDLYSAARASGTGGTWDRAIASIRVNGPPRTVVTAPPPQPSPYERPPTVVVVPPPPPPPPVIVAPRLDRRTAELIVQRAYREVLDRPADPEGLRTYRDRLIHQGWTEQRIIEQLQRSGEARAINPDQAITRMYREILGREPDPGGLANYKAKWRDGWTQGRIRADLRRSEEYRQKRGTK